MKKIFIVFALCVAFLLTLSAAATNVRGDVDQNGTRTFYDALQILQYVVNNRPLTGSDVNRDGQTSLLDVIFAFKLLMISDTEEGIDGMTLLEFVSNNHSPKVAGDVAMQNMIRISSDEMKGTHDAQYVFANGKAYVVYEANNEMSGDPVPMKRSIRLLLSLILIHLLLKVSKNLPTASKSLQMLHCPQAVRLSPALFIKMKPHSAFTFPIL